MLQENISLPGSGEPSPAKTSPLAEVAALFLRLGFTAFGGPATHRLIRIFSKLITRRVISLDVFCDLNAQNPVLPKKWAVFAQKIGKLCLEIVSYMGSMGKNISESYKIQAEENILLWSI